MSTLTQPGLGDPCRYPEPLTRFEASAPGEPTLGASGIQGRKEVHARVRLHEMLAGLDVLELAGHPADSPLAEVTSITNDSRRVTPRACFACIPGAHVDGHDFAAAAVRGGASALLVERLVARDLVGDVAQARVPHVRAALGPAAATLFGRPSRAMRCVGITGTNGKTTTTYVLEAIAHAAGLVPGVIGTTGARVAGAPFASAQVTPTTPEACDLQLLFADMRDAGVGLVAMEVSSHALDRREVDGTEFAAVCFTNLSHEHLDYHGSLDAYFDAKARLFDGSFAPAAAVNLDDESGTAIAARVTRSGRRLVGFGRDPAATITADHVEYATHATSFRLVDRGADRTADVRMPLVGPFNVSNALAAAATARAAGLELDAVVAGLAVRMSVPGRLESIERGQRFAVLVDYAHTPDALARVLDAARTMAGGHRVIVVFGAGGDRDRAKRPLMGQAVGRGADLAVLTSDNPRTEDPGAIADAVLVGLVDATDAVVVELDRRLAIRAALTAARPGDVVVVAGKGHETGQTIGTRTEPFDDRIVVGEELEALGWS